MPEDKRWMFGEVMAGDTVIERAEPMDIFRSFEEERVAQFRKDRQSSRRLIWFISTCLIGLTAATLWLVYLHSTGSITLPSAFILAAAATFGGGIMSLLGIIIANPNRH